MSKSMVRLPIPKAIVVSKTIDRTAHIFAKHDRFDEYEQLKQNFHDTPGAETYLSETGAQILNDLLNDLEYREHLITNKDLFSLELLEGTIRYVRDQSEATPAEAKTI